MALEKTDKIWMDGEFVDWDDAKLHVCAHVIHYGSAVFEGMRCYKTPTGTMAFRLGAHIDRLFNSAKIYRMDVPYSKDAFSKAILETVRVNKLDECPGHSITLSARSRIDRGKVIPSALAVLRLTVRLN